VPAIKNKLAGDFRESAFEVQLDRYLRHNYSPQQAHGKTRTDFVIENDHGERAAVLEIKDGGWRDFRQAVRLITLASKTTHKTLFVATKGGTDRVFSPMVKKIFQKLPKALGVKTVLIDKDKPQTGAKEISRTLGIKGTRDFKVIEFDRKAGTIQVSQRNAPQKHYSGLNVKKSPGAPSSHEIVAPGKPPAPSSYEIVATGKPPATAAEAKAHSTFYTLQVKGKGPKGQAAQARTATLRTRSMGVKPAARSAASRVAPSQPSPGPRGGSPAGLKGGSSPSRPAGGTPRIATTGKSGGSGPAPGFQTGTQTGGPVLPGPGILGLGGRGRG
jgi:hypothetical protein